MGSLYRGAATIALMLAAFTTTAQAQTSDARVARVKRLVSAGERSAAQQLADSMLVSYPQGTNEYADALYARALSSASAADAERDYLRISIEYPLSPRSEDALMMVAQLRLARGDRAGARRSFERLTRDYPSGEQIAKASFWAGRLALDDGDGARACPSLQRAQQLVSADDVELKNQIDYYVLRCSSAAASSTRDTTVRPTSTIETKTPVPATKPSAAARAAAARDSAAKVAAARRDSIARADSARRAARDAAQRESAVRAAAVRDSLTRERARRDSISRDSAVAESLARGAIPNEEPAKKGPPPRTVTPPVPLVPPAAAQKAWSVQVAAFPKERDAKALSEVLEQRGFSVRVVGDRPPYRVRVGRYPTREEAAAALGRMKAKRLNGVVVEAEPQ